MSHKRRHAPTRSCVGCGGRSDASTMFRFGAEQNGKLVFASPTRCGRSAYLHRSRTCVELFSSRRHLERSLKKKIMKDERLRFTATVLVLFGKGEAGEQRGS
ncbi:MAG: YlxR family protein [Candidatus Binatia bacterium]